MNRKIYKVRSEVWLYPGMAPSTSSEQGAWHFVSVSKKQSEEIKKKFGKMAKGWGSLPVIVTLGKTSWKTSIFPDKKSKTYLLPLKAEVRKKEDVVARETVSFLLDIRMDKSHGEKTSFLEHR